MSRDIEPWDDLATNLGFTSEKEMLADLYENMSIEEIATNLGVAKGTVRRRLEYHSISIKPRGGRHGERRLAKVSREEITELSVSETSKKYNTSPSLVYRERRVRKWNSVSSAQQDTSGDTPRDPEDSSS